MTRLLLGAGRDLLKAEAELAPPHPWGWREQVEWEQRQVKITTLGLMLLPIKPMGILPNFQSSKTKTLTKSALLNEQPKDGQRKSWIQELLPPISCWWESEHPLPQALHRLQALRG